jgi:peptide subunit release factor 1 (eRF1)
MTHQLIDPQAVAPHLCDALPPLIERLAAIPSGSRRVLSCYLRLGPRDRTRGKYLTDFRGRRKGIESGPAATLDHEARSAVERDLDRMERYLENPRGLPHATGIALFACEALELFEAMPLAHVHRPRLVLDDTPWIAELVAAEAEFEPILAVVSDRAHTRFFEVSALKAVELPCLVMPSRRGGKFHSDRADSPGWGERDYHGRLEEERHRRCAATVTELERRLRGGRIRGIVLAGPADYTGVLARFLPDRIRERLLGTIRLNPTATSPAEVQAAALAAAEDHARSTIAAELLALENAFGTGWALNGPREALRALHRGQARTLYIREGLAGTGFRCGESGRLVLAKADCRAEGEPRPVLDLVDEAIEEALRLDTRVVMVPETLAAETVDGLAATLRFR